MKHLKNFNSFLLVEKADRRNFNIIFTSLYKYHLSINEQMLIKEEYGMINESWFSDLADKASRGVLKVATSAGQVLVDLAKKAKEVLDFAKLLATKIGEYVKNQFTNLQDKVKNYALKDNEFVETIIDFIKNKKPNKLKSAIESIKILLNYIISGKIITDLVNRLSETFSNVLNTGTNEGLFYLENEFLFEAEETEKKSFLERLGEKIMSFPPFNWIPKIDEMMKKGISALSKIIDKFFSWLTTGKASIIGSKFVKGVNFIFNILEIYVYYKVINNIQKFKEFIKKTQEFEDISNLIKDKTLDQLWSSIGFNPENIINGIKDAVKKIPFVGDILSILDSLVIAIGTYLAVKPSIEKVIIAI